MSASPRKAKYRLELEAPSNGRIGKATIHAIDVETAKVTYTDKADVETAATRNKAVNRIAEALGLTERRQVSNLRKEFEALCNTFADRRREQKAQAASGHPAAAGEPRRSQADDLVELVSQSGVELFHTPGGHDGEAYATIPADGHLETWPVGSSGFKDFAARLFYTRLRKVPNGQAMLDARNVLSGHAKFAGPEHAVHVRLAERDGEIWLDLADDCWRSVRVGPDGWEVCRTAPVKFIRKRGMLPLPLPVRGGSIADLHGLANLPADRSALLFDAFMVAAMRTTG